MPDGTYDLTAPVCGSTGEPPAYPAVSYRVALFDFDDLTERSLALDGLAVEETYRAKDCTVIARHTLYKNYDGIYSARHDRKFSFDPPGCALTATARDTTLKVAPEFSDLMKDSDDRSEELPFEVATDDDHTYRLTSGDYPDLNELWGTYGCAKPDRLKISAVRRMSTD